MGSFSEFFGRKGGGATAQNYADATSPTQRTVERSESWADTGARIGGENEILRNLLVDTGRRIGALDDLKDAFGKLVDPISKTLRTLEQEKSENVSLRGTLNEVRQSYEALRTQFSNLGQRAAASETEVEKLRSEFDIVQQQARSGEIAKAELISGLSANCARASDLEQRLAQEVECAGFLRESNQALSDHAAAADKRIVELEHEGSTIRERLLLLENEKRSTQMSLDELIIERSRLSHNLAENEKVLTRMLARVAILEEELVKSETECSRLVTAIDEADERRRTETSTLSMRLDAMRSRVSAAENLLAEARQGLLARMEENRVSERKFVESTIARNAADKKLEQMLFSLQQQERKLRDLESSRAALVERSNALLKTAKARETALARAEEKIAALSGRVTILQDEAEQMRVSSEKRLEVLAATLRRERLEHSVTEGALEATRKNYVELQRELASARHRRGLNLTRPPPRCGAVCDV